MKNHYPFFLIILFGGLVFLNSCKKDLINTSTLDHSNLDNTQKHLIKEYKDQILIREYVYSDHKLYHINIYNTNLAVVDTLKFEYNNNLIINSKQSNGAVIPRWYTYDFLYNASSMLSRFSFGPTERECLISYDNMGEISNLKIILPQSSYGLENWIVQGGNVVSNANIFIGNFGGNVGSLYTYDNKENPLHRFWIGETTPSLASVNNILNEAVISAYSNGSGDTYYDTVNFEYTYQYNENSLPISKSIRNVDTQETIEYYYEYFDL